MSRYFLSDGDGSYSADAGDYWYLPDSQVMGTLVKQSHPYRTVTRGRIVYAPRVIREEATMRDLRRLERSKA